jgi:hypothetical protein
LGLNGIASIFDIEPSKKNNLTMEKRLALHISLCFVLMGSFNCIKAQVIESTGNESSKESLNRTLPFGADWAKQKGIDLPFPFGITAFYTLMSRNVNVTDVSVQFLDQPSQSIDNFSSFAVRNTTSVEAIRFDTWILPVLNVYGLFGYANTNANLKTGLSIDRPVLPGPPVEMNLETTTKVNGPYLGIGSSLVAGYKSWFVLADANYGETWPDELNNSVNFTFLSVRSGLAGKLGTNNSIRGWLGAAYLYSVTTLEMKVYSDVLEEVTVRVAQQPENPWTMQCGWMVGIGKRYEFMTELGSNFDDASVFVLTGSYRF